MSAIPRAVRKQVELAEKKRKETYETPQDPPAAPPVPKPASAEAPPPPAPSAATPPPSGDTPQLSADEQRYRTLQGKYDAETSRMREQIVELRAQIDQLQALLSDVMAKPPAAPEPAPEPAPAPVVASLTEEEIQDYGPDMINMIKRLIAGETQQLRQENDQLKTQLAGLGQTVDGVGKTVAHTARGRFLAELDGAMPEWRTINRDPRFLDSLQEVEPYSGRTRKDLLDEASKANDAARALAFFRGFAQEQTVPPPATPTVPQTTVMDTLVAPRGSGAGSVESGAQKNTGQTWTRAEVARFYNDVRKGVFNGNEKKRQEIENEIFAAQTEGRILP